MADEQRRIVAVMQDGVLAKYEAQHAYAWLVGMARAAGWRRANDRGDWYRAEDDIVRPRPLGIVIESILRDHGVDLRQPVPGEEQA